MSEQITIPKSIDGIERAINEILSSDTPAKRIILPAVKKERIYQKYKRIIGDSESWRHAVQKVADQEGETYETVRYIIRVWPYLYRASEN